MKFYDELLNSYELLKKRKLKVSLAEALTYDDLNNSAEGGDPAAVAALNATNQILTQMFGSPEFSGAGWNPAQAKGQANDKTGEISFGADKPYPVFTGVKTRGLADAGVSQKHFIAYKNGITRTQFAQSGGELEGEAEIGVAAPFMPATSPEEVFVGNLPCTEGLSKYLTNAQVEVLTKELVTLKKLEGELGLEDGDLISDESNSISCKIVASLEEKNKSYDALTGDVIVLGTQNLRRGLEYIKRFNGGEVTGSISEEIRSLFTKVFISASSYYLFVNAGTADGVGISFDWFNGPLNTTCDKYTMSLDLLGQDTTENIQTSLGIKEMTVGELTGRSIDLGDVVKGIPDDIDNISSMVSGGNTKGAASHIRNLYKKHGSKVKSSVGVVKRMQTGELIIHAESANLLYTLDSFTRDLKSDMDPESIYTKHTNRLVRLKVSNPKSIAPGTHNYKFTNHPPLTFLGTVEAPADLIAKFSYGGDPECDEFVSYLIKNLELKPNKEISVREILKEKFTDLERGLRLIHDVYTGGIRSVRMTKNQVRSEFTVNLDSMGIILSDRNKDQFTKALKVKDDKTVVKHYVSMIKRELILRIARASATKKDANGIAQRLLLSCLVGKGAWDPKDNTTTVVDFKDNSSYTYKGNAKLAQELVPFILTGEGLETYRTGFSINGFRLGWGTRSSGEIYLNIVGPADQSRRQTVRKEFEEGTVSPSDVMEKLLEVQRELYSILSKE